MPMNMGVETRGSAWIDRDDPPTPVTRGFKGSNRIDRAVLRHSA